jgi:hypothetical protein
MGGQESSTISFSGEAALAFRRKSRAACGARMAAKPRRAEPISSFGNEIFFFFGGLLSAADRVTFSKFSLFHLGGVKQMRLL